MNLGAIVNPGDVGGLRTAISGYSVLDDASLVVQLQGKQGTNPRSENTLGPEPATPTSPQSPSSAQQRKLRRRAAKQPHQNRGGAKTAIDSRSSTTQGREISPRHTHHRQPPYPAGDRPRKPHAAARQASSASLPPSSPARSLLRCARAAAAAADADWRGRRSSVMDVVLAHLPAVSQYREDTAVAAIERSEAAALGPAPAQSQSVYHLEDGRSSGLYWEAQTTRSRLAAGDGAQHAISESLQFPGYEVSAERSTAAWPGDEDEDAGFPPLDGASFPESVGAPQHTNVSITVVPTDRLWSEGVVRTAY